MSDRAYLDWNATAPLRPEARAAMAAAFDWVGNPSSTHAEGRAARHLVEEAREKVAALVGAEPRNVIFTSGGTEANALALTPTLAPAAGETGCSKLFMSTIEHPSVRTGGRFRRDAIEDIPVTPTGVVDLGLLQAGLEQVHNAAPTSGVLVALMHANNETGVVQPVAAAAELVHAAGGLLHVDAVQSAGKIPFDINALKADLLVVSAHKLGGPKGIGALVKRSEAVHIGEPLLTGGGQERGARGGTENLIGIAGFGAAAEAAGTTLARDGARIAALRDQLETQLLAVSPEAVIFGKEVERLPNTTMFAVPGLKAEMALIALDLAGIAASSGSACSSGKVTGSPVLAAMNVPAELAGGAIRLSIGPATTERELGIFISAWRKLVAGLSKKRSSVAA
ncbi:MAG: cysteine desulfurase family protein [Xanthobacteraceae bacterium]